MKKWNVLVLLQTLFIWAVAGDGSSANTGEESTLVYLVIGLLVLSATGIVLIRGQKRKFND